MTAFRCAIWAAVSTPGQAADDKASIPNQISKARDLIQQRGWTEAGVFEVPGHSRSITFLADAMADIPAMNSMVVAARRKEFDLLICYAFDRLARTASLLAQLRDYLAKCRVQIYSMTAPVEPTAPEALSHRATMSSAAVSALSGLMAEDEVARFVERSRFGKRNKAKRGLYLTQPPFGYRNMGDGVLIVDPQQAEIVRRIFQEYVAGYGLKGVALRLNADGIPSPRGGVWVANKVRALLTNPAYAGKVRYGYRMRVPVVLELG
jgi:site-specific DNA recombinase